MRTENFAKDIAALVAAVLVVFAAAVTDNRISVTEAVNMALAFVTTAGVILSRNGDGPITGYLRGIIAFAGAALALMSSELLSNGITLAEWTQVALAGMGALGVVALPDERTGEHVAVADLEPSVYYSGPDGTVSVSGARAQQLGAGLITPATSTFDPAADDVTFRPGATRRELRDGTGT